jgi:hypothetical protein
MRHEAITERDAKNKDCCNLMATSFNERIRCSASICMAWRWYETIEETIYAPKEKSYVPQMPKVERVIYKAKEDWTGYCGLGGKL